jgi:ATP-binding cassette subfamily F protein 3
MDQIAVRIEKENMKNAQLEKTIQENKDKANIFAMKGGQMRLVAKRMREKAEELEEEIVDVKRERKIQIFKFLRVCLGEVLNITDLVFLKT